VLRRAIELCVRHGLEDWVAKPRLSLAFHHWASRRDLPTLERLLVTVRDDLDRLDRQDVQRALTLLLEVQIAQRRWEEARATFTLALAHGGPRPVVFFLLLGEWEERFEREGERERFVELCREWQSQARASGVPGLPNQWFLEAATPAAVGPHTVFDESFGREPLPPELTWVDPLGVGHPELRPGRGLILAPPLGLDLWPPTNLNAPRLMLRLAGDFIAETRVEIEETEELFAGLLLWESELDFVRLERCRGQNHGNGIKAEACSRGSFIHVGRGRFLASGVWLRMERFGGSVRCLCSEDRRRWWTCGSVRFPAGKSVEVGMTCITRSPGAAASFQRFIVWTGGDAPAMNGK
jgi:regulation of enolase protein 1 (concanavalin A-like superfamily)